MDFLSSHFEQFSSFNQQQPRGTCAELDASVIDFLLIVSYILIIKRCLILNCILNCVFIIIMT